MKFKFKYNNFLQFLFEKLKTRQVRKCSVIIFETNQKTYFCRNYTYNKYCAQHQKLLAQECKGYHLYNFYNRDYSIESSFIEYFQRQKFSRKYLIVKDQNHTQWENHLENIWSGDLFEENGFIFDINFIVESYFLDFIKLNNL